MKLLLIIAVIILGGGLYSLYNGLGKFTSDYAMGLMGTIIGCMGIGMSGVLGALLFVWLLEKRQKRRMERVGQ